jgi:cysteine desulfuration protein SufE
MDRQEQLIQEFSALTSWEDRYKRVIDLGKSLPQLSSELYDPKYLVKGCQSQVWLHAELKPSGEMVLHGDSDALIVKGLVALLIQVYSGMTPEQVLKTPPDFIDQLGFKEHLSPSRANGFLSMLKQIQLYAQVFCLQNR